MTLFDSPELEVFHDDRGSDCVLVTFNDRAFEAEGQPYWGYRLARTLGFSALGIKSKAQNWFPPAAMAAAAAQIAPLVARHRFSIGFGNSMGGYAALKYAGLLGTSASVAISPQISIDPADVGRFDRRYRAHFDPSLHAGMRITQGNLAGKVFVIHDPLYGVDQHHVDALVATGYPIGLAPAYHTDHHCLTCLADSAALREIFAACRGDDLVAMRATIARKIRKAPRRRLILARAASGRRPEVAERIITGVLGARPADTPLSRHDVPILVQIADTWKAAGDMARAKWLYQICLRGYPGQLSAFVGLADISVPRGDLSIVHPIALQMARQPKPSAKQQRALLHYAGLMAALLGPLAALLPRDRPLDGTGR